METVGKTIAKLFVIIVGVRIRNIAVPYNLHRKPRLLAVGYLEPDVECASLVLPLGHPGAPAELFMANITCILVPLSVNGAESNHSR